MPTGGTWLASARASYDGADDGTTMTPSFWPVTCGKEFSAPDGYRPMTSKQVSAVDS